MGTNESFEKSTRSIHVDGQGAERGRGGELKDKVRMQQAAVFCRAEGE